jgi:hypothetical protein
MSYNWPRDSEEDHKNFNQDSQCPSLDFDLFTSRIRERSVSTWCNLLSVSIIRVKILVSNCHQNCICRIVPTLALSQNKHNFTLTGSVSHSLLLNLKNNVYNLDCNSFPLFPYFQFIMITL